MTGATLGGTAGGHPKWVDLRVQLELINGLANLWWNVFAKFNSRLVFGELENDSFNPEQLTVNPVNDRLEYYSQANNKISIYASIDHLTENITILVWSNREFGDTSVKGVENNVGYCRQLFDWADNISKF